VPVIEMKPEPVVEVLHGVTVIDPYRWLEDRSSLATQHWLEEQQQHCEDYFAQMPAMNVLRTRVCDLLSVETLEQPARVGDRWFFRRRRDNQEQACLCVRAVATGEDRVLIDPSAQGPYVSVAIHRISEDGSILAYAVKHGGERTEEVHFVDVESGRIWDDHLEKGYARGLAFAFDNMGFYYCHELAAAAQDNRPHEICYHHFGCFAGQDPILFSMPRTRRSRMVLISDDVNVGAAFIHDSGSELRVDLYLASRKNLQLWRPIFVDKAPPYGPFLHSGRIYAVSFVGAPNGQILELHRDGSEGSVIVPPGQAPIGNLHLTENHLYVSYRVDNATVIQRWAWTGKFLGRLPEQPEGSFGLWPAYTGSSDALLFSHESFSEPPSILEYSEATHSYVRWIQQPSAPGGRHYRVQKVTYPSKDGIPIPMWVVALDTIEPTEGHPTILTSYGGFGVSVVPRFSALVAVMLELGCVFALPNIRGGSEFGKEWHEAARRRNRQVAFDDFLAAAEWLGAAGITRSNSLAIFGGSNSGLLVAAAMTQRPELFRAVLCIAPLLDMLRYEQFGDAGKWREEYGTVEDEDDFHALYAYSPYHHVHDEVNYPATMFVSGDKDAQCDPAHVRKMAARLRERSDQKNSILVDHSVERGHTPALPLSVRIEALTRRVAFLCNELRIDIPPEELP
jgi:prolyl oligopeptidase